MENITFNYTYSAEKNKEVESIRRKYLPHSESEIDTLRKLDARVRTAGVIEGLCIGVIGALIFGIGTCFFLGVFAGFPWLTALLMITGALVMIPAYPIYRKLAQRTKTELTPEILRLSEKIMNQKNFQD